LQPLHGEGAKANGQREHHGKRRDDLGTDAQVAKRPEQHEFPQCERHGFLQQMRQEERGDVGRQAA
jgi:hypothetical protein